MSALIASTPQRPPGPRLPAAAQSALLLMRPFPFVEHCWRRYGDIFRLELSGVGEFICLFNPGAINAVLAADGKASHAGEANKEMAPVIGEDSILTIDRDRHLARRRLTSPAFHGQALKALEPHVEAIVADEEARWPVGVSFAARPAMQAITFRVIAKIVLGVEDAAQIERLIALLEPVFNVSPLALSPTLRLDIGRLTPWGRFVRARQDLEDELAAIVAERRIRPPGPDLLSLLLEAQDGDGVPDDLLTFLLAGHETTATALSWTLERLARHPEIQDRARRAAAAGEIEYLDAVIHETLRIRPIVSDVGRVLSEPLDVMGYRLPAGSHLRLSVALLQGDAAHYPEPERFNPERFVQTPPDRSIWLPFGGGRRRCVGAALAQLEMRSILTRALSRYRVIAPDPRSERQVQRGATLAPHRDAVIRLERASESR